jgi:hypothetical protein
LAVVARLFFFASPTPPPQSSSIDGRETATGKPRQASVNRALMLIRLFQQDTRYSVRAWRGLRFPVVCENSSGSSAAKRPVRSIWPRVVGLMDLSVLDVGTNVRMS